MLAKDTYKGNVESKLSDINDTLVLLLRRVDSDTINKKQLKEILENTLKDLDSTKFYLTLI